jgi:Flp pilus assembly protein TadB
VDDDVRKGRATPSRKEAEAARKKAMKPALTRKEQLKREREARATIRQRQQEAMRGSSGSDERYLPARDRGPVRRVARDYVDRRRTFAEYLLPVLIIAFVATLVPPIATVAVLVWVVWTALFIVDEIVMIRGLKKEIRRRFPDESTRGITLYVLLRSTQMRRLRLPKAQIPRNAPLPDHY